MTDDERYLLAILALVRFVLSLELDADTIAMVTGIEVQTECRLAQARAA